MVLRLSRVGLADRLCVYGVWRACVGCIWYGRVVCCSPGIDGVVFGAVEGEIDICVVGFEGIGGIDL